MKENKAKQLYSWQIGEILYPLLVYYVSTILIMNLSMAFLGNDSKYYMICQILVGIVTLPLVWFCFYKKDRAAFPLLYAGCFDDADQPAKRNGRQKAVELAAVIGIALLIGTGINNIVIMAPITEASEGFAKANEAFFAGKVLPEIIGSGILTPILEELVYRGVIAGRLRRMTSAKNTILISALIFAVMHFNMVQFVYAFFMGLLFGWFLEHTGDLKNSMAAHMAVNLLAILRTESGFLSGTVDHSVSAWCLSLGILFLGIAALEFWGKRRGWL